MTNIRKTILKMVAILMATTIATTGIISAGAYATYGSSSTAAASKSGYKIFKYGVSKHSNTEIINFSGKSRFVIPQVMVFKANANGKYNVEDYSKSGGVIVKKGYGEGVKVPQSSGYRRYWHRGVLNNTTSYSSGPYYIYDFNKYF